MASTGCGPGGSTSKPVSLPVTSMVERMPSLFLVTGLSVHGFSIGLGAGWLAAELIADDAPLVDPRPFCYARLVDGSISIIPG